MTNMTEEEAIKTLKGEAWIACQEKWQEAINVAVESLELIKLLNNRPCEVCEYHKENGCCRWTCDFDKVIYDR